MDTLTMIRIEPQPGPLPGLWHVGYKEQAPGDWVPLYDSAAPSDRPSINTAAGWNALAERMMKKA